VTTTVAVDAGLAEFFDRNRHVALGFSGGVDSSYLLYAGLACGADIKPYYVKTALTSQFEFNDAVRLTDELNVELIVLERDALAVRSIASNPSNRCYFCKLGTFQLIATRASEDGFTVMVDGTNASDDASDRPGMKALAQLEVRSPLREAGLTKQRIRDLSHEAGLFTWDKPAYACLASRVPTGIEITFDNLRRVEGAEAALRGLGFSDVRVRLDGDYARVQVPVDQMSQAITLRQEITEALKPHFSVVLLDLAGR